MSEENFDTSASSNVENNAERDVFSTVNNYYNESGRKTEELLQSLVYNRKKLEEYKNTYSQIRFEEEKENQSPTRTRNTYFSEIDDTYRTIESIKHELKLRGIDYEIDSFDREHPDAAFKRYKRQMEKEQETDNETSSSSSSLIDDILEQFKFWKWF